MDGPDLNTPRSPPNTAKVAANAREVTPAFGLGRFAPFSFVRTVEGSGIQLHGLALTLWLIALAFAFWLSAATSAFLFIKYRRGFTDVRFSHVLFLPWQLDEYRRSKGEFLIREGLAKAAAQEWRAAFGPLRTGLLAVPEHREARMLVARIYLMAGRADMTRTVLLEGLPYHGDQLDYLREVLGYFFGLQADDAVIGIAQELSPRVDPRSPAARMLSTALAYAYFNRSRYTECQAVLTERHLLNTPEGRFVTARIAWERGLRDQAIMRLRELTAQVPQDPEIYRTLIHYLHEQRQFADIRRASLERQLALPDRTKAYLDFIAACHEEADTARRDEAKAAFLELFSDNTQALLQLAELATAQGRPEIARTVFARCQALGRDEPEALTLLMGALLATRRYDEALALWTENSARIAKWHERHRLVLGALRGVAYYGNTHEMEAQPLVRRLTETRLVPAPMLASIALQLEAVNQPAEARRLLQHATDLDPLHQPTLVLRLQNALAENLQGDTAPLIERLLSMRKPPPDLLRRLTLALQSDLHLFHPRRDALIEKLRSAHRDATATTTGGSS